MAGGKIATAPARVTFVRFEVHSFHRPPRGKAPNFSPFFYLGSTPSRFAASHLFP